MRKFGNYVEKVSRDKLFKQGYYILCSYWSDHVNQQNMLSLLVKEKDYVYTQKRDNTGLFHIIVYVKK